MSSSHPTRLAVFSWALYDLANTIFSINIVSLYFGLWIVNVKGGTDSHYGYAAGISMLLLTLCAPILGALSDQARRRIPFLVTTTLLCVAFTLPLGVGGLSISLVFFAIANFMFQAGLIFYDALLPAVSTDDNRGKIGGLGIGLGYLGSFIGVGAGQLLLDRIGYAGLFRLTALLFLLFAIPCFSFVREPVWTGYPGFGKLFRAAIQQSYPQGPTSVTRRWRYVLLWSGIGLALGIAILILVALPGGPIHWWIPLAAIPGGLLLPILLLPVTGPLLHARQHRGLLRFLAGRALYTDSINTVILFVGIYATNELGLDVAAAPRLLLGAIGAAVVAGLIWGIVVDGIGPKRSLNLVLIIWMVVLTGTIGIAVLDLSSELFWAIATIAGVALGGTWAADRPYMLRLAPPRYIGEFYGLYSMVGRFASIIGPFSWAYITDTLGLGRPAAVGMLLVMIVLSFVILQGVDDQRRQWPAELS